MEKCHSTAVIPAPSPADEGIKAARRDDDLRYMMASLKTAKEALDHFRVIIEKVGEKAKQRIPREYIGTRGQFERILGRISRDGDQQADDIGTLQEELQRALDYKPAPAPIPAPCPCHGGAVPAPAPEGFREPDRWELSHDSMRANWDLGGHSDVIRLMWTPKYGSRAIEVSWGSVGAVDLREATEFAQKLASAVMLARTKVFDYNVKYVDKNNGPAEQSMLAPSEMILREYVDQRYGVKITGVSKLGVVEFGPEPPAPSPFMNLVLQSLIQGAAGYIAGKIPAPAPGRGWSETSLKANHLTAWDGLRRLAEYIYDSVGAQDWDDQSYVASGFAAAILNLGEKEVRQAMKTLLMIANKSRGRIPAPAPKDGYKVGFNMRERNWRKMDLAKTLYDQAVKIKKDGGELDTPRAGAGKYVAIEQLAPYDELLYMAGLYFVTGKIGLAILYAQAAQNVEYLFRGDEAYTPDLSQFYQELPNEKLYKVKPAPAPALEVCHAVVPAPAPGLKWNQHAGGTAAAEGKYGYVAVTEFGEYHISPHSTPHGRHLGYVLYFINNKGKLTGGLWQQIPTDLEGIHSNSWSFRSPNQAKARALAHYKTNFEAKS